MMKTSKALAAGLALGVTTPACASERLYACGDDQVREYRMAGDSVVEIWRWTASTARDLPHAYRTKLLAHIDDCKPVDDNRSILVTASTGGVVLIDRATGKVRFRATAPMAHSADLLPGGYVAVALSIHQQGDRLNVYKLSRNDKPLGSLPLPSGHGVVWDQQRQRLFALSHAYVQSFVLGQRGGVPVLNETARWTLPGRRDGHDLSPIPRGGYVVTTDDGAWRFDPDGGTFVAIPALNPKLRVKAVTVSQGAMAWVQAEENWWAHAFTIAGRDTTAPRRVETPGLKLYKVRWIR